MKIQCEIIRDILPLYAEDMVSQPTREMVEEHLGECEGCAKELASLQIQTAPAESGVKALKRVKDTIRRRRVLSVMAAICLIATLLTGSALMLDAQVYISAEKAVEEIWVEGDTVKIRWNEGIIATGSQYYTEDPGNYAVVAWTNLLNIMVPPQRVPYEELDEEVKQYISREAYDSMDSTSTYAVNDGDHVNFWYYDMASGDVTLLLDGKQPYPEHALFRDSNHIRVYIYGLTGVCVLLAALGICFRRRWYGKMAMSMAILTGSCALSSVIVTAGQMADIYGRFTEMLVDSSIVALPMVLCGLCAIQLIQLKRRDKGL